MFNIVGVEKERASPVFPHPLKSKGYMCIHDRVRLAAFSQTINHLHNSFSPPDNLLHKIDTYTSQGGEGMGQPSFSPPPKKQRLHVYSWQSKVGCVFADD